MHYIIDQEAMIVSLPIDVAVMTREEQDTLAYASSLSMESCLAQQGFSEQEAYDRRLEISETVFREIGPWTEEMASTWGYQAPPDSAAKNNLISSGYRPGEEEAIVACEKEDAEVQRFNEAEFELDELKYRVQDNAPEFDVESIEIIRQDLNGCLSVQGYSLPSKNVDQNEWVPLQVAGASAEQERRIALADVACKEEHNIVDRWAEIGAVWENEALAVHTAEIASYRKKYDPIIAEARTLIESHG